MDAERHQQDDMPLSEIQRRVIYALLAPVARLAGYFGMSLKELVGWLETAYFNEVRNHGKTLKETADALQVSQRTAVRLSKQLREAFLTPELEHHLPRRLEFMLALRPMSLARLSQVLPEEAPEQIEQAVTLLLKGGRLAKQEGRTVIYATTTRVRRLPRDSWQARIGGLNSLLDNLGDAVFGRFLQSEPRAFARTLSFRASSAKALHKLYEQVLLPAIIAMSEEAEQGDSDDAGEAFQLSVYWAPYEHLRQTVASSEGDD